MSKASLNSVLFIQAGWRIFAGLLLNILIVIFYTLQYPPDGKMGYFFGEMAFGFVHVVIGIAVIIFRVPARSIVCSFTMVGNLLFCFYFFAFMVNYSNPEVLIHLVFTVPALLLGFGLVYRSHEEFFQSRRESL